LDLFTLRLRIYTTLHTYPRLPHLFTTHCGCCTIRWVTRTLFTHVYFVAALRCPFILVEAVTHTFVTYTQLRLPFVSHFTLLGSAISYRLVGLFHVSYLVCVLPLQFLHYRLRSLVL